MTRVAIIGGGFAGLGAAFFLNKSLPEAQITVFEGSPKAGGLASGFKTPEWEWSMEHFIHHWFSTDTTAFDVARAVGLGDKLILRETKSSCFYKGRIARLDSVLSVLTFPFISFGDRLRMGLMSAWLKFDKNYKKYEKYTAYEYLKKYSGKGAFEVIWQPLFEGKFGAYAPEINAAWFWGRIHARTKKLGYIEGGFQTLVDGLVSYLKKKSVDIRLSSPIDSIRKDKDVFVIKRGDILETFDYIILTSPLAITFKIVDFPHDYMARYSPLNAIGAQYFVLELNESLLDDGTYWLNINERGLPFMMVAEHTNFVDKKHYGGKHMVWVGKYLDYNDSLWIMPEADLLDLICSSLQRINPKFKKEWIHRSFFTRVKNAQPIVRVNQSAMIPDMKTPVKKMYLATMSQVYPWDRGTENALILGKKASELIVDDLKSNLV